MYSQFSVDFRDEKHRPSTAFTGGRHRAPEERPEPVAPPAWDNEHARPIPALVGERPTVVIRHPSWAAPGSLPMPLPARAEGAALEALRSPEPKPRMTLLGQLLDVAKRVFG